MGNTDNGNTSSGPEPLPNQFLLRGSTKTGPIGFATTPGNSECGSCFVGPRLYLSPLRASARAVPGADYTEATNGGGESWVWGHCQVRL